MAGILFRQCSSLYTVSAAAAIPGSLQECLQCWVYSLSLQCCLTESSSSQNQNLCASSLFISTEHSSGMFRTILRTQLSVGRWPSTEKKDMVRGSVAHMVENWTVVWTISCGPSLLHLCARLWGEWNHTYPNMWAATFTLQTIPSPICVNHTLALHLFFFLSYPRHSTFLQFNC